jgi:hypothetical protein
MTSAVRSMWRPLAEERADAAEELARARKVVEMVEWLRASYREYGVAEASRSQVDALLDSDDRWDGLEQAVGRTPTRNPLTRAMVLEYFHEEADRG